MAEEVAFAVAEYIGEDWVFAEALASVLEVSATVAAVAILREDQRRQQSRARDAYNANLRDRYVMVRSATEPRQVVLGRPVYFVDDDAARDARARQTMADAARAAGWYVEFSWQGMPLRWTALDAKSPQLPAGRWRLLEVDQRRRPLLIQRKMLGADGRTPGELLTQNLEILLSTAR